MPDSTPACSPTGYFATESSYDALAWVLFRLGKIDQAAEAASKAIGLGTPEPSFYFHAGMIALAAGEKESARKHLTHALELNPAFNRVDSWVAREQLTKLKGP